MENNENLKPEGIWGIKRFYFYALIFFISISLLLISANFSAKTFEDDPFSILATGPIMIFVFFILLIINIIFVIKYESKNKLTNKKILSIIYIIFFFTNTSLDKYMDDNQSRD